MFITLFNEKEIDVIGTYTRHCKPTMDINTGYIYASMNDVAQELGVSNPSVSIAIKNEAKCKGHTLITLDKLMSHADKVSESIRTKQEIIDSQHKTIRAQAEVIAKYEAIIAEQEERRKAKEALEARKAEYEAKRQALEEEALMLEALEKELGDI